jgi:molybdopterin molybdotransferase
LAVTRQPRVAVLSTGDELVPPGSVLGPDQIVASNAWGIGALLRPLAREIIDLGIVPDQPRRIEDVLLRAFDAGVEVVITSGGASVGDRDHVRGVLTDLGVELDFWKLNMRPGKPLMFGRRGESLIFGLPGNPVSALVTAMVIVRPALRRLCGHADPLAPRLGVPLAAPLPPNGPRRHFVRGTLEHDGIGLVHIRPVAETDSAHSSSLAHADALIVQPENSPGMPAGDIVELIPLHWS